MGLKTVAMPSRKNSKTTKKLIQNELKLRKIVLMRDISVYI